MKTDFFLYYARTGLEISIDYFKIFCASCVYLEGHWYLSHVNKKDSTSIVAMNFPNSDKVISNKITKLLDDKEPLPIITGGLLGYQFESKFYLACK